MIDLVLNKIQLAVLLSLNKFIRLSAGLIGSLDNILGKDSRVILCSCERRADGESHALPTWAD